MARTQKDWDWGFEKQQNGKYSYDAAQLSVLMDIRDDLKALRETCFPLRHLNCGNFQRIPATLRKIAANTTKPVKAKK